MCLLPDWRTDFSPHDKCLAEPKELQEERRLMYVAITRARKKLYLTYAAQRLLHGMPPLQR